MTDETAAPSHDSPSTWHDVAALEEIGSEFPHVVKVNGTAIALLREGNRVYAIEDFCPHQGSPLSGGFARDGVITCPLHAWQFRLADGSNVDSGPGVKTFPVRIEGVRVIVQA